MQAPVSRPNQPAAFASSALQPLQQLATLSLGSFSSFHLSQLPPSVRRLRLRYDDHTRTLPVPQLPAHIRWGTLLADGSSYEWFEASCGNVLIGQAGAQRAAYADA